MVDSSSSEGTRRRYARVAGFLFLWLIVNGIAGSLIYSRIEGKGTFAETAKRIAASERFYRVALSTEVIETLSAVLLAFALYATLKPVNSFLAQLAMIFSLEDSILGWVVRICSFVRLHLYTSSQSLGDGAVSSQVLVDLTRYVARAAESVGGICFGIGSLLFFYLFFKSKYLPRVLSALGVIASTTWTCLYLVNLVYPEYRTTFRYISWPPMAIANVATGFWLLFAVKSRAVGDPYAQPVQSVSR